MALVPFAFPQAMSDIPGSIRATPATHSLSGTVVNSISGEPVRRALVQAGSSAGGNPISVFSDAEGRFEFASLPESEIVLSVRKPGFFNELELHPDFSHYELVHLGADASSVVLKLVPEGTIVGHVVSSKGEAIEDSTIRIFQEHIVEGRKRWDLRSQVSTDEDGQFRVANLVPGQYLLVAGPDLPGSFTPFARRSSRLRGSGTTFYPGVPNLQAATPLAIAGGQQLHEGDDCDADDHHDDRRLDERESGSRITPAGQNCSIRMKHHSWMSNTNRSQSNQGSLFDQAGELEDRENDAHGDEADHAAHDDDHEWFDHGGDGFDDGLELA